MAEEQPAVQQEPGSKSRRKDERRALKYHPTGGNRGRDHRICWASAKAGKLVSRGERRARRRFARLITQGKDVLRAIRIALEIDLGLGRLYTAEEWAAFWNEERLLDCGLRWLRETSVRAHLKSQELTARAHVAGLLPSATAGLSRVIQDPGMKGAFPLIKACEVILKVGGMGEGTSAPPDLKSIKDELRDRARQKGEAAIVRHEAAEQAPALDPEALDPEPQS